MLRLPRWSVRRWLVLAAALVVVVAALVVVWVVRDGERTRLERAVELVPASTQRFSWTDWTAVRAAVDADVDTGSSAEDVRSFLLTAYDRDLTATTALDDSGPAMQTTLGFSPASLDWELFAQGADGAVIAMGLPEDYDVAALRDRLRELGYAAPDEADGVWDAGTDLVSRLGDGSLTPELAALQIDEDDHVLYAADQASYLRGRADAARGEREDATATAAAALGDPWSALLLGGDQACTELAMSDADEADKVRAAELVKEAGGVHPLTGFGIATEPGGDVRVAMTLENDDQAREDADSRSRLAAGEAPGQGGTFPERFRLGKVSADGTLLTMALKPREGQSVLSDLADGPLLFATC